MSCYFLQGAAAIGVLAAFIGGVALLGLVLYVLIEEINWPTWTRKTAPWVFGVSAIGVCCVALAFAMWELGGDVIHSLFHFCVGN